MVLVRILMSKSGFDDEVLIKLIVGVVKHVTIDELVIVDCRFLCVDSSKQYPRTDSGARTFVFPLLLAEQREMKKGIITHNTITLPEVVL
jgi:hypothetical protein